MIDRSASPFDAVTASMMRANEANWDARTSVHVASDFYGLNGSKRALDWFAPFEWDDLGTLSGRDVPHLQCHLGTETHAFDQLGASSTVGLDFSAESVEAARFIARTAGARVEYVQGNVYDAATVLGDRRFDVIYTGKGSLCYLPDLPRWASVVAGLLRGGGVFYITEFHPLLNSLGPVPKPSDDENLLLRNDYLAGRGAIERDATYTYTDGPAVRARVSYEWMHGMGEIVSAVTGAGLIVELVRETELLPWQRWKCMVRADNGWWRLPDDQPRIPLLFALRATKPF